MIEGLVDNWLVPVAVGVIALLLIWGRRMDRPRFATPEIAALADQHADLVGQDVSSGGRIAAIKRLRGLRPDIGLRDAKDVIELIVARRTIR